ncbi:MAG: ABC transporter ATP-binding protein [Verrucomicrobiota bacterium]
MDRVVKIYKFGLPYLWKYRVRFGLSILLSLAFATINASFVPVTKMLVDRIDLSNQQRLASEGAAAPAEAEPAAEAEAAAQGKPADLLAPPSAVTEAYDSVTETVSSWADVWMPHSSREMDWRQLAGGLLILPMLALLRGITNYISAYYSSWVSSRVMVDMRVDVFEKLQTMSMDFFHKEELAATLARVNADAGALHSVLQQGMQDAIKSPFTIILILMFLAFIDWQLTLLFLVFMPVIMLPIIIISRKVKNRHVKSHRLSEINSSALMEGFINMRITKAFNLSEQQRVQFRRRIEEVRGLDLSSYKARFMLNPIIEVVSAIGVGVIIVFIFSTGRSVGDLTGFIVGLGMLYQPIKKLAGLPNYFAGTYRPVERLLELFRSTATVTNKPGASKVKAFRDELAFEKIDFAYNENVPVLEDFGFRLPVGKRLGLAGHSGSGKSTIVNLVFRFYDPTRGRVVFDGRDLRDLDVHSYREQLALVSQDVLLFNLSVADNIALGRRHDLPSRAEIVEAAVKAHAHEFIEALPHGYDTVIGERGERLSGGQRQRLSIARAFVRDAPILVLDEATGALDAEAEAVVQRAIDELAANRTVICIAHRLATLFSMDEIIVLEEGRAIERGSFSQLLESGGSFAGMAARQGIRLNSMPAAPVK